MTQESRTFTLVDFDFSLPPELIAQHPAPERSASRLLDGRGALPVDRVFRELPALLQPGDLLVVNDTRVIKARLLGEKPTGGAVEALVERVLPGPDQTNEVLAHLRASKSPRPSSRREALRSGAGCCAISSGGSAKSKSASVNGLGSAVMVCRRYQPEERLDAKLFHGRSRSP